MRYIFGVLALFSGFELWAQGFVPAVNTFSDEVAAPYPLSVEASILNYQPEEEVLKLEKLEIGVRLPVEINYKVENFVAGIRADSSELINPYLEWELKVQAVFFHENGLDSIVVDGFYTKRFRPYMVKSLPVPRDGESYADEEYNALGGWNEIYRDFPFRIRFAPPETGRWRYVVRITTPHHDLYSAESYFSVIESGNKGYLKVNRNQRFLELGGTSFYPVGMNAPWPASHPEFDPELYQYHTSVSQGKTYYRPELYRTGVAVPRVYQTYKEVLGKMNDAGVNYFRTIMTPVSTEIEWEKLGDYTQRLSQAQEMDEILELAEERNMYIHWDMASHFTFKYNVYSIAYWDWIDNDGTPSYAYKSALNLDHPTDFFKSEEARKYYKQRLRYILARWGYSTHIGVFELICEISNIGSELDDNDAYYHAHHQVYEDWQAEMGAYIKSQYNGKVHLLTASYSGEKHTDDATFFKSATYDVMTSNIYDFGEPDFSSFFTKYISRRFLNESPDNSKENVYTMECTGEGKDQQCAWNVKPMIFSETDPIQVLRNCEQSTVELNRSLWQSIFSGLAASLSWTSWQFTGNYAIYGQMNAFMADIDLGNGNWHPGASRLVEDDSLKRWEFEPSYAAAMNAAESKADIAYLRSGDLTSAIGVLSNKTYNIYNADSCLAIPVSLEHLKERQTVFPAKERLKIKGMKKGNYKIEYFLPGNQQEAIFVSYQRGTSLEIDLPYLSATREGYVVLFRVASY